MYNKFVKYIYFPFIQKLKGERVYKNLKIIEESQWFSYAKLKEMQWKKLQQLVSIASENTPYYKEIFKTNKININDIKSYEDFLRIPILTKEAVRNSFNQLLNSKYRGKFYKDKTSGSMGLPLETLHSLEFESLVIAGQWRARRWFGVDIGQRALYIWGSPLDSAWQEYIAKAKARLKNIMLVSAFELSEEMLEKAWQRIKRFRPHYIYGYAFSIYKLAEYIRKSKQTVQFRCKGIFTTAETIFAYQREIIASIFACSVSQEYGSSEVGAFAYECPHRNLHIYLENIFIEFLRDNKPVRSGETGEIVVTPLTNHCMPLIRYKLGDMGSFLDKKCSCGRGLPLMDLKIAKITDIITAPKGNLISSEIFDYINLELMKRGIKGIKYFRVNQEKNNFFH